MTRSPARVAPRPRRNEYRIIKAAAKELLPDVLDWMDGHDEGEDEVLSDLAQAIEFNDDGYAIARDLDNYAPDASLVEILDNASHLKSKAYEQVVQDWVAENGITLMHPKGTAVRCPRGTGTITDLRPKLAQYVVTPPDEPQFKLGGGWIIAAEDCTPVDAGAPA